MSPEEFAHEFGPEFAPAQPAYAYETGPYGSPAQPVKPGLTKRGKAAIAISAAVIAGGGMLFWQDQAEDAKASALQAQELQYKRDLLALQMQKELNKANAAQQKTEADQNSERSKLVAACVDSNKKMVGKLLGVTYQSVRGDCEAQYPTTTSGDMQAVATAQDTTTGGDGGGIPPSVLLGVAVGGALLVGVAANRGKKTNAA